MIVVTNNNRMGRNILFLRQKHNLSQDFFARMVGMDTDCVDAIERGSQMEMDAQILEEICRRFDVSVFSLMEELLEMEKGG